MSTRFWDRVPIGYEYDPKTGETVPSRPTPGELFELLLRAAGPHLVWVREQQAWCYFEEPLWPDRTYIELSRRGYEVNKTTARDVFVAVAVTDRARMFGRAEDDTAQLRLVEGAA